MNTKSSFYFGHTINTTNFRIDFKEGAGADLVATLNIGSYALEEFKTECARAMTAAGTQTYAISLDRSTRLLTVSAASSFTLLQGTGPSSGTTAFSLMGFSTGDVTGTSLVGDSASGSEYLPQFLLQSYISVNDYQEAATASVNQSGSGLTEVVSFGTVSFMECNITFVTDIEQGTGNPIETNLTGVADLRSFMQDITLKSRIEFIEDRATPNSFTKLILESTPTSKTGTGYRLRELYGRGLPGYFESGLLKFRKVV